MSIHRNMQEAGRKAWRNAYKTALRKKHAGTILFKDEKGRKLIVVDNLDEDAKIMDFDKDKLFLGRYSRKGKEYSVELEVRDIADNESGNKPEE